MVHGGSFHLIFDDTKIHTEWVSLDEIIMIRDYLDRGGRIEHSRDYKAPWGGAVVITQGEEPKIYLIFGYSGKDLENFHKLNGSRRTKENES